MLIALIIATKQPAEEARTKPKCVTHFPREDAPTAAEITKFGEPVHHSDQHAQ